MQAEIGKKLIMIRKLMDFFDDGYHLKEIGELTKMSNELFEKLTEVNQEKFKIWLENDQWASNIAFWFSHLYLFI